MDNYNNTNPKAQKQANFESLCIFQHFCCENKIRALESLKIDIEKAKTELQKANETTKTIKLICKSFKLGVLLSHKVENHNIPGYLIANFETKKGNYQFIFKN